MATANLVRRQELSQQHERIEPTHYVPVTLRRI